MTAGPPAGPVPGAPRPRSSLTPVGVVATGGLGTFITDGLAVSDTASILTGALLVAVLAVLADAGFGLLERVTTPTGVKLERGRGAPGTGPAGGPATGPAGGPAIIETEKERTA